jgi:hypothetical protein
MKLSEIQHAFQLQFPYLKLLFFAHTHPSGGSSTHGDLLDSALELGKTGGFSHSFSLEFASNMTVMQLEGVFQENCNVGVQVFRRSGSTWIQTSVTDSWTLAEQNETGESDSQEKIEVAKSVDGFREQD